MPPPVPPPVPPEPTDWHFTESGRASGPVTWTQLRERAASGQLLAGDMVWKEGMTTWATADAIPGLFTKTTVSPLLKADPELHFDRGVECIRNGKHELAIIHLTQAIQITPGYAEAYVKRGLCYSKMGEDNKALADTTEAIRLFPNNARYYFERVFDQINTGNLDSAIADAKEAIRLDSSDRRFVERLAECYNLVSIRHQKRKEPAEAIIWATEALALDSSNAEYHRNRANYHCDLMDYAAAVPDFEKAIELDGTDADSRDQLQQIAVVFYNRGCRKSNLSDYSGALADFEVAIRIDPADSDFRDMLRRTRQQLGMSDTLGPARLQVPSESWSPGVYYYAESSWHLLPAAEDEFVSLVKSKSITVETLVVRVPDALDPVKFGANEEAAKAIERIHQEFSGAWSVFKRGARVAGSILMSALLAPQKCCACRKEIPGSAKRCPYCTEYQ